MLEINLTSKRQRDSEGAAPKKRTGGANSIDLARPIGGVLQEPYSTGTAGFAMPGYPHQLVSFTPNPDGRPGSRPADAPFALPWRIDHLTREIEMSRDMIVRIVRYVAGNSGAPIARYLESESVAVGGLDMLIANAALNVTPQAALSPTASLTSILPPAEGDTLKSALRDIVDIASVQDLMKLRQLRDIEEETRAGSSKSAPSTASLETSAAFATELDRQIALKERDAILKKMPSSASMAVPPAPYTPQAGVSAASPAPPDQARPAAFAQTLGDLSGGRRVVDVRAADIALHAQELEDLKASKVAADSEKNLATFDANGNIVSGINNYKRMLLYLLMQDNPTETKVKLLRELFDKVDPATEAKREQSANRDVFDPTYRINNLKAIQAVAGILRAGEGGYEWVTSPQQTGYVFLTDTFRSAVTSAYNFVRFKCGKGHVPEIDLMTHDRVYTQFGDLILFMMRKSQNRVTVNSRLGGSSSNAGLTAEQRGQQVEFEWLFKRLIYAPSAGREGEYLGFEGRIDLAAEQRKLDAERARQAYMDATGRYYTDQRV